MKRYPCPECGFLTCHHGNCPNDDSPVPDEPLEAGIRTIFDDQDFDDEDTSTADIILPDDEGAP